MKRYNRAVSIGFFGGLVLVAFIAFAMFAPVSHVVSLAPLAGFAAVAGGTTDASKKRGKATTALAPSSVDTPSKLPDVKLSETTLHEMLGAWSPSEIREGVATANKVVELFATAQQNVMQAGVLIHEFEQTHGEAKTSELVKAISRLGVKGLTEGNIYTLRQRARVLLATFPNAAIRKHLLLMTGGEGLVIRSEAKENNGEYIVSPFYSHAIEAVGKAPTTDGDAAERYARLLVAVSRSARGNARNRPTAEAKAKTMLAGWEGFVAFCVAENKDGSRKHANGERVIAKTLAKMVQHAISEAENVDEFAGVADILADSIEDSRKATPARTAAKTA